MEFYFIVGFMCAVHTHHGMDLSHTREVLSSSTAQGADSIFQCSLSECASISAFSASFKLEVSHSEKAAREWGTSEWKNTAPKISS